MISHRLSAGHGEARHFPRVPRVCCIIVGQLLPAVGVIKVRLVGEEDHSNLIK